MTTSAPNYVDWRTFEATGVNLGSWFYLDTSMVPKFFEQHGNTHDEWTTCEKFGAVRARPWMSIRRPGSPKRTSTHSQPAVSILRISIPFV